MGSENFLCPYSYPDLQGHHKVLQIWGLVFELCLVSFIPQGPSDAAKSKCPDIPVFPVFEQAKPLNAEF